MMMPMIFLGTTGCKANDHGPSNSGYQQVTTVADTAGYGAARVDANLKNAWGIAIGPTGAFWIAAGTSTTTISDRQLLHSRDFH